MSNINCLISAPSDPPSILNDLVKRIQEAIPLDQTIPFWKVMWKRHLISTEGERLRSQKAAVIEYAAFCSSLMLDEIHFSSACELLFDLVLIRARGSEQDWYDRLSIFQLIALKKYFAHFNNALEACDGEVEGHQSAETAEHELLDSSDLSDHTESEPEYSGPQSIFLIKFRNFHTFLKDTFLSSKSAQELKMSIPTYQPKGPRQKRLETACYPTANEATNLLRLELAHHLKNVREIPELTSSQIRNIIQVFFQLSALLQHEMTLLQKSELPSTIAQITSPQYLVHYTTESKFSFHARIYQQTALFYQLGTILNKWTPLEVKEIWNED
ncbi:hypothetical protein GG344DRAFT_84272 [Lentinula edodes]|nr:hypothetical protein GG344DRAFT_84272 [Lentinula edodes]